MYRYMITPQCLARSTSVAMNAIEVRFMPVNIVCQSPLFAAHLACVQEPSHLRIDLSVEGDNEK